MPTREGYPQRTASLSSIIDLACRAFRKKWKFRGAWLRGSGSMTKSTRRKTPFCPQWNRDVPASPRPVVLESGKQKAEARVVGSYSSAGRPGGTRTPGPLVRSQVLYPTELQVQTMFARPEHLFRRAITSRAIKKTKCKRGQLSDSRRVGVGRRFGAISCSGRRRDREPFCGGQTASWRAFMEVEYFCARESCRPPSRCATSAR